MTPAGDTEAGQDHGAPFFVIRMAEPPQAAVEALEPDLRDRARANLERARRIFRSRTLPCAGSDARLSPEYFIDSLSSDVDAAIFDGIRDEAALAILRIPSATDGDARNRIAFVQKKSEGNSPVETRNAATLLGKYWYRYQKNDVFDYIKLVDEIKTAQERGEPVPDVLRKPPTPPRRR